MSIYRKIVKWINIVVLLFSAIFLAVIYFVAKNLFLNATFLCILLIIPSVLILICICFVESLNYTFEDDKINKLYGKFIIKQIFYNQIRGITIVETIYRYGATPVLDENKNQVATLLLYNYNMCHCVTSARRYIVGSGEFGLLYHAVLNVSNLQMLLKKTNLSIYITEKIYLLHNELLDEILNCFPDRFIVSYYDKYRGQERKSPYKEYCFYAQKNL